MPKVAYLTDFTKQTTISKGDKVYVVSTIPRDYWVYKYETCVFQVVKGTVDFNDIYHKLTSDRKEAIAIHKKVCAMVCRKEEGEWNA